MTTKPEEATEKDREAAKKYLGSIYPAKDFANPYNYTMVIAEHSKSFIAGTLHERAKKVVAESDREEDRKRLKRFRVFSREYVYKTLFVDEMINAFYKSEQQQGGGKL